MCSRRWLARDPDVALDDHLDEGAVVGAQRERRDLEDRRGLHLDDEAVVAGRLGLLATRCQRDGAAASTHTALAKPASILRREVPAGRGPTRYPRSSLMRFVSAGTTFW